MARPRVGLARVPGAGGGAGGGASRALPEVVNCFPHSRHLRGPSAMWIFRWAFRFPTCAQAGGQTAGNHRSSVLPGACAGLPLSSRPGEMGKPPPSVLPGPRPSPQPAFPVCSAEQSRAPPGRVIFCSANTTYFPARPPGPPRRKPPEHRGPGPAPPTWLNFLSQ